MVRRVYVEKKPAYAIAAKDLLHEAKYYLHVEGIEDIRVFIRYDVENITDETYEKATRTVFAEPPVDDLYEEQLPEAEGTYRGFRRAVHPLPQ